MIPRPLLPSAAAALLATAAPSQSADPGFTAHHANRIPWPAELGLEGGFGRAVVGRFGARWNTGVVLRGRTAVALHGPHVLSSVVPVAPHLALNDLAVRRDGVAPGVDTLVTVGDSGLHALTFDPALHSFTEAPMGSDAWNGARRVVTGDTDGKGGDDVVAIGSDGMRVLVLAEDDDGAWTESAVPVLAEALDVVPFDYYPGGPKELVVLTVDALQFYDADSGAYLAEIRTAHPGGALTVCRTEPGPGSRIAWTVIESGASFEMLHHFSYAGMEVPVDCVVPPAPGEPATALDLVGVAAGDWDGDGNQDLVLPHRSYQRATLLMNQGEPQSFTATAEGVDLVQVDLAQDALLPAPENGAVFGFGPLANPDRDAIVAPVDSIDSIVVLREPTSLEQHAVSITGGGVLPPDLSDPGDPPQGGSSPPGFFAAASDYEFDTSTGTGSLHLELDNVPASLTAQYTHLQVLEWFQPDPTVAETDVDPVARRNDYYPIASSACPKMWLTIEFPGLADLYWADRRHSWLHLRFVTLDAAQTSVATASSDILVGMTLEPAPLDDDLTYLSYLAARPGAGGRVVLELGSGPGQAPHPIGDAEVGSLVVQQFLPPFPAGQPPMPPQGSVIGGGLRLECVVE